MPRPKFHAADARKKKACCTPHYGRHPCTWRRPFRVGCAALLAVAVVLASSAYGACRARSGPGTAALVELYTAQTCSGCTAADSRLQSLAKRYPPDQVVPIVLYVDDGDYIDSSVRRRIWQRERRLLPRQRTALVYTPQV